MIDPGERLPFNTYRSFDAIGNFLEWDLAPSLLHHYESEKFRGVSEDLRLEALQMPTTRELRKFTKRRQKKWRPDWPRVRGSVLRAGMAMQALHVQAGKARLVEAFHRSLELSALKSIGGLPGPFFASELQYFMRARKERSTERLGVVALNGCVPTDICARLDSVYAHAMPFSATVYAGLDADPTVEMWCAMRGIPVKHVHMSMRRLREAEAPEMTKEISTLVACLPDGRAATNALRVAARRRRAALRFLEFQIPTHEVKPSPSPLSTSKETA